MNVYTDRCLRCDECIISKVVSIYDIDSRVKVLSWGRKKVENNTCVRTFTVLTFSRRR